MKLRLITIAFLSVGYLNAQIGNYLNFDEINDYVDCESNSSLRITGTTITLEAMVNFHSFHAKVWQGNIINKEGTPEKGYMLRAGNNGAVNFNFGSNPGWNELDTDSGVLTLGVWHHIAATYDGATMKIYVDGVLVKSRSIVKNIASTFVHLYIGATQSYPNSRNADAEIDEVRIWNITRTAEQIDANKSSELANDDQSGLVAYYKFNETEDNMIISGAIDETGENHGVLVNFDKEAPVITSGATATAIDENSGSGQVVYTVTAMDNAAVVSYAIGGTDVSDFTIDSTTGAVRLTADPDYEIKSSYSFDVTASDGVNTSVATTVSLAINNVEDGSAPVITSVATATAIDENSGSGQVVYTVTATDADAGDVITYGIGGIDAGDFTIDSTTGAVRLTADPDYEVKSSYSFDVTASDGVNTSVPKTVSLLVNNVNDGSSIIKQASRTLLLDGSFQGQDIFYRDSGGSSDAYSDDENSTFIVQARSNEVIKVTFSDFHVEEGFDELTISGATENNGAYTGNINLPDFYSQEGGALSFKFTSDGSVVRSGWNASIIFAGTAVPVITSVATATAIDENSGSGQVVYTVTATDADAGDVITYGIGGIDAGDFTIDSTTGAVRLTADPDYEVKSSYSFDVTASDGVNTSVATTVSLAINNVEDGSAPVITSVATATAIDENSGSGQVVYTVTATDADAGDVITYGIGGIDAGDFTIDSTTGAVRLTADPDYEVKSSYSFDVTASDGVNTSVATTVSLAINNLNENTPVITSVATATAIDENSGSGQVIYTVTATDADGNALTYGIGGIDAGDFTIDSTTGAVRLTADPDYEVKSSYSFDVTASDGVNTSVATTVSLAINNLNENTPVITSVATATAIDENSGSGQVVYTVTATDADAGDVITYGIGGIDAGDFTIDSTTGAVRLTADPDYEVKSSYSFDVTASDGVNTSVATTVSLAINNLNENTPVITSVATATAIDENSGSGQVIYTVTATDADGNALTYGIGGIDAGDFTIDSTTGAVRLTADPDYEVKSSYSFDVTASDGVNTSVATTVSLAINNLNENTPVITSVATATAIDENSGSGQVVYTVTATDADAGDVITYGIGGIDAGDFTIDSTTGAVRLTADPDYEVKSSYSFDVTASDGVNTSVATTVSLAINNLNENTPVITSVATATAIDENSGLGQVVYTVTATDADGNALTYGIGGIDAGDFTIDSTTGAVRLTADPDYEVKSSYSFDVTASDGVNTSVATTVSLAINNLNENTPVITSVATATAIDENSGSGQVVYTVTATDADAGDVITYGIGGIDAGDFTIDSTTGAVRLTADPDYEVKSSYSFDVTASDGVNTSVATTVSLAINNLNENTPVITSVATATAIDENSGSGQVIYTVTATDADGNALTYGIGGIDAGDFTIDSTTGAVRLTADPDYEIKSSYSFDVTASDGVNTSVATTVSLAINNLNENTPVITSVATATAIDENSGSGQVVYTVTATDADGNALTYGIGGIDAGDFTIDSTTGAVRLTADPDYEVKSSYSFDVTASDGVNTSVATTVSLAINNLNENTPVITSVATATAIDENSGSGQVVYTVTATDADAGDVITYGIGGIDAGDFTIDSTTGAVRLTADPDYEVKSSYSFDVTASDGVNTSVATTVSLAINNLNENTPVITSVATATAIDENSGSGQVVYTVTATDADAGDVITYGIGGIDAGDFTIDSTTGAVRLTADPDYEVKSSYSFDVTASDGVNTSVATTVSLAINNLNENTPVITSVATATAIDENSGSGQVVYTVTATDADAGDVITYGIGGIDAGDFTIDSTTGAVRLTADPDYEIKSSYSFDVTASDGVNTSVATTVSLAINDVEETPLGMTEYTLGNIDMYVSNRVLYMESTLKEKSQLYVYNILGKRLIYRILAKGVSNTSNNTRIDLSSLPTGIYLVKIKNGQGFLNKKIIVE